MKVRAVLQVRVSRSKQVGNTFSVNLIIPDPLPQLLKIDSSSRHAKITCSHWKLAPYTKVKYLRVKRASTTDIRSYFLISASRNPLVK